MLFPELSPLRLLFHRLSSRILNPTAGSYSVLSSPSRVQLFCGPMDCSPPGSSVHGISQAGTWSGLPFPSAGDLPNPGIELAYPALACGFFTSGPPGKPSYNIEKAETQTQVQKNLLTPLFYVLISSFS